MIARSAPRLSRCGPNLRSLNLLDHDGRMATAFPVLPALVELRYESYGSLRDLTDLKHSKKLQKVRNEVQ